MEERIGKEESAQGKTTGRIIHMPAGRWIASAAAAVVIALVFWWIADRSRPGEEIMVLAGMEEVVSDTLPDGSTIMLNRNSSLSYPEDFRKDIREVELSGEAFFHVEPDKTKPFVVNLRDAGVKVLGTSFNVKAYPDETIVVMVASGEVCLFTVNPETGDTASVLLSEGMKGILFQGAHTPEAVTDIAPDELFWMNRTLEFRQACLRDVIGLLETRYGVTIRIADETIGNCRLTAGFSNDTIDTILMVIADTFGLTLEQENGIYVLHGEGCPETGL